MKKVSSTEAIRRGFSILGSVSRSPMSSRDIFQRLYDDGFNVSIMGDKLALKYQGECRLKDTHDRNKFEI